MLFGGYMGYLDKAIDVLKTIESYGYQAYIIGGAVRDYLLGIETNDIDMTTNMPVCELAKYFKILENGSDYESVTILVGDESFEITHFRRDVSYDDHRHPNVELVDSLYEDTLRRDFTINALAMDSDMDIIDYHKGIDDLNNGIIRTIGNPYVRFDEDALRILRALHFSSKLDFSIETETLKAIIDKKNLLSFLSEARLYDYFTKILYSSTSNGIDYINKYDLFNSIPVFNNWIKIVNNNYNKEELEIVYYLKYKELPLSNKKYLNACKNLVSLIESNFDEYIIYNNLDTLNDYLGLLGKLGYDINAINNKINKLSIKSDNDLAVSKSEIASMFEGNKKSEAINKVIMGITHNEIKNDKESILAYLKER